MKNNKNYKYKTKLCFSIQIIINKILKWIKYQKVMENKCQYKNQWKKIIMKKKYIKLKCSKL